LERVDRRPVPAGCRTSRAGLPAAEKGERWLFDRSQALAKIIRPIKADQKTQRLQEEFFGKMQQH
jgi:hypothetical protein